jgi:hypothetical protein
LAAAAVVAYAALLTRGGSEPPLRPVLVRVERPGSLAVATLVVNLGWVVGLVLLVLPGLFLAARLCLYVPVIVLEGRSWRAALVRSNQLVRGRTWSVLGVLILVLLIAIAIGIVPTIAGYAWESVYGAFIGGVATDLALIPLWGTGVFVLYRRLALESQDAASNGID